MLACTVYSDFFHRKLRTNIVTKRTSQFVTQSLQPIYSVEFWGIFIIACIATDI